VKICYSDRRGNDRLTHDSSSYTQNEYIFVDQIGPFGGIIETYRRIDRLKEPSKTFTLFEIADSVAPGLSSDHTHSRGWTTWDRVTTDIQPDRHQGSANYLFADSHVQAFRASEMKRRIESGENFARPPQ
jgi:prepilin-type processing-associated H-X9-DG protein